MGIFQKIKQNFSHGGVKLEIQSPSSASMQTTELPVTVTVTATQQAVTISKLTIDLMAIPRLQDNTTSNSRSPRSLTGERVPEPFSLQPGESKVFTFNLSFNIEAALEQFLPENMANSVGKALQKLQIISQTLGGADYNYSIQAVADVEGIAFDPSASKPIQLLAPNQIGGSIGGSF